MPGASGSHLLEVIASTPPFSSRSRYFPGPDNEEVAYLHGIYGWKLVSVDESEGPQAIGWKQCKKYLVSIQDPTIKILEANVNVDIKSCLV